MSIYLSLYTSDLFPDVTCRAVGTSSTSNYPRPACSDVCRSPSEMVTSPSITLLSLSCRIAYIALYKMCKSILKPWKNHIIPPKFAFENIPPFPSADRLKLCLKLNEIISYLISHVAPPLLPCQEGDHWILSFNRGYRVRLINQVPK